MMSATDEAGSELQVSKDDRHELSRDEQGGWHRVYRGEGGELVVEWLEYRDPAPYDHATRLIFSGKEEDDLRQSLGVSAAQT